MELQEAEALAERAAALVSFPAEVQLKVPLKDTTLSEHWFGPWQGGSDSIDEELQVALMDKADSFDPGTHCPTLKRLVDEHAMMTPVSQQTHTTETIKIDNYELDMKKVEYDTSIKKQIKNK